jgi:hypothetical protein
VNQPAISFIGVVGGGFRFVKQGGVNAINQWLEGERIAEPMAETIIIKILKVMRGGGYLQLCFSFSPVLTFLFSRLM